MKKLPYIQLIFIGLLLIISSTSCTSYQKMVYFQGDQTDTIAVDKNSSYSPTFKPDDYITVLVTAEDPETAVPFNFPQDLGQQNQQRGGMGMGNGPAPQGGYLIDDEGNVDLPVLGVVKAGGKTRKELKAELKKEYDKYLNGPVVNIQIRNFKITVLGDVQSPGIYIISNERVTILEAIGMAGDLQMTGERKNVLVIRDNEGVKTEHRVDLTSKDLFKSPVYYLEQNDVVYIEPNAVSRTEGTYWRNVLPVILSLASFAITTILLLTN